MICVSIGSAEHVSRIGDIILPGEFAEIRLDLCKLSKAMIRMAFSLGINSIATCRIGDDTPLDYCTESLIIAIDSLSEAKRFFPELRGYVDIDIDSPPMFIESVKTYAKKRGCGVILSYHNYKQTPDLNSLEEITRRAFSMGADIAKIAVYAHSTPDAARVMELYKLFNPSTIVAFAMGRAGAFTRMLSIDLGAPFSYCSLSDNETTAPGQLTARQMRKYFDIKSYPISPSFRRVSPGIATPASKSHSQRAIIAAGLSCGTSRLDGYTPCNDSEAAIALLNSLGVIVKRESKSPSESGETLIIESPGFKSIKESFCEKDGDLTLFTRESGLLTRLVIPLAAVLCSGSGKSVTVTGEGSVLKRSFAECSGPLHEAGIEVKLNEGRLPAVISGELNSSKLSVDGKSGSQFVSGLLIALPLTGQEFNIEVSSPSSRPYIDITISVLKSFGIDIINNNYLSYNIKKGLEYISAEQFVIDGDWSSAASLLVTGAINSGISISNLRRESKQADEMIFDVLKECGVDIYSEEQCSIVALPTDHSLKPFNADASDSPDLFPSLVLLALSCNGVSRIGGVNRLYNKESNRAESLYWEFTKLGAEMWFEDDYMCVKGGELKGGRCSSHNDHRIAMALICASLKSKGKINIDNIECINKSFPGFINLFY